MAFVIIVGHYTRAKWIDQLHKALPNSVALIDYDNKGSTSAHRSALMFAQMLGERAVIMEDDAIPIVGFLDRVDDWFEWCPNQLISFYLGTNYPPKWQPRVDRALAATPDDHISLTQLIHGVCYSIPPSEIGRVLERMPTEHPEADYAVGMGWGREVIYPVESLVEHRDGASVERHYAGAPRTLPRVARKLAGPLMYDR